MRQSDAPWHPAATPGTVAAVHQFHAGSALGDAITNSMFLIRRILRARGFHSDIFVQHRDPRLGDELYDLDALPRHDGYVLLLHHSLGISILPDIVALPAPKVFVYHNITPPEFISHPETRRLAVIGRQQLAAYSGHVVAALADSTYNAIELHAAGFPSPQTCPLLFDTAALRHQASLRPRRRSDVFTVLFVGRIVSSKAQDELIAAFSAFKAGYGRPCRLVLPGAMQEGDADILLHIERLIAGHGLHGDVVLPGLISDEELQGWYARADLYVSLSRHEGFGVPLVEAMAHGVPVLAWPAGAIPYTLGGASELALDRAPDAVAAHMLALAADPARRAAIVAAQHRRLGAFDLDYHVPVLMQAIARAGAAVPDRAACAAMAANMRFTVAGHVNGTYSLAAVNRAMARTLDACRPGAVRLIPVEGAPTSDISGVPEDERAKIAAFMHREPFATGPEALVSQHYPIHVPAPGGDVRLAMVFWEESLLPPETAARLNAGFDAVLAPSAYVAKVLRDSGVSLPVLAVGQAPPLPALPAAGPGPRPFTFLHVSSAFPRKGVDVLLAAWAEAFGAGSNVRLTVKTFPNPHNEVRAHIAALPLDIAPVGLIDRDLDAAEMAALYAESDCMVLPTRGEGYNLVAAEALAAGLKVIVTGLGGHMDFCTAGNARLLPFRHAPSGSHLATPHSVWAEPDQAALVQALRDAPTAAAFPERTRRCMLRQADPAAFVDRLANAAAAVIAAGPAKPVRVAWVSSWQVRCEVAEYSRGLLDALPRRGIGRLAIICDDRTPKAKGIEPAGRLGDARRGADLLAAIMREDADIVVIQHQPGLLGWPALTGLLKRLAHQPRAVVVALHNTRQLLQEDATVRAATIAALGDAARILVHTLADLDLMQSLGLGTRTALLPHGAPAPSPARWTSEGPPIVGSTGFFLPGKGIDQLIGAMALLKPAWPGLRLRLVCAEYGTAASTAEIASCRALADAAGLEVEWHTGFLSPAESAALLADCRLVVLPYEPSLEASSASLRSALAAGVPVVVTPIALFDEAAGAVMRLSGGEPAEIASGVAALLADPAQLARLQAAGQAWLDARQWPSLAARLHGMLLGFAAQARVDHLMAAPEPPSATAMSPGTGRCSPYGTVQTARPLGEPW